MSSTNSGYGDFEPMEYLPSEIMAIFTIDSKISQSLRRAEKYSNKIMSESESVPSSKGNEENQRRNKIYEITIKMYCFLFPIELINK